MTSTITGRQRIVPRHGLACELPVGAYAAIIMDESGVPLCVLAVGGYRICRNVLAERERTASEAEDESLTMMFNHGPDMGIRFIAWGGSEMGGAA